MLSSVAKLCCHRSRGAFLGNRKSTDAGFSRLKPHKIFAFPSLVFQTALRLHDLFLSQTSSGSRNTDCATTSGVVKLRKEGKKVRMFRDPLTWLKALAWLRFVKIDPMKAVEQRHRVNPAGRTMDPSNAVAPKS